jgi:hypothetical protein
LPLAKAVSVMALAILRNFGGAMLGIEFCVNNGLVMNIKMTKKEKTFIEFLLKIIVIKNG